jgi:hypothetical protein
MGATEKDRDRYRALMARARLGQLDPDGFQEIDQVRGRLGETECARIDNPINDLQRNVA